jgi:hypothetical protein
MYDARMMTERSSVHGSPFLPGLARLRGEGGMAVHQDNYVAEAARLAHETLMGWAK